MKAYFEYRDFAINNIKLCIDTWVKDYSDRICNVYLCEKTNVNIIVGKYIESKYDIHVKGVLEFDEFLVGNELYEGLPVIPESDCCPSDEKTAVLIINKNIKKHIIFLEEKGWKRDINMFSVLDVGKYENDFSEFGDRDKNKEITTEEDIRLQFNILKYFRDICDKNNINYYLAYGTLLGAIRHKGFIPWDDDVDVHVFGEDMERLIEVVNNGEGPYEIIWPTVTKGWIYDHALLVDKRTIKDRILYPIAYSTGMSIDIWPLWGIPEDSDEHKNLWLRHRDIRANSFDGFIYESGNPNEVALESINTLKSAATYSKYVGCVYSVYRLKDRFEKNLFEKKTELKFEEELFTGPQNYDEYLTTLYGDYMTPPPEERRGTEFHSYKGYWGVEKK